MTCHRATERAIHLTAANDIVGQVASFDIRRSTFDLRQMEFLIHHDGRDLGPYSASEVRSRLISGAINLSDLAWREGSSNCAPLSSFPEFAPSSPPPPPLIPATPLPDVSASPPPLPQPPPPPLAPESLGSYTAITLQADERPLHKTTIHWMVLLGPVLGALLSLIIVIPVAMIASWKGQSWAWVLVVIPAVILASGVITVRTSELVITDRRVLIKVGFIRRQTFEMFISKIESVAVAQGMIGRMFDYGTVEIRGTGGSSEAFSTIAAPLRFRDAIQLVQSNSERR